LVLWAALCVAFLHPAVEAAAHEVTAGEHSHGSAPGSGPVDRPSGYACEFCGTAGLAVVLGPGPSVEDPGLSSVPVTFVFETVFVPCDTARTPPARGPPSA
jgi:hypothetical protein